MAAVSDCFSIGSIVACSTCFHQVVEGEVLAFDQQTKMLILKCQSENSTKLHDVYIVNLSLCSDVQVKKEVQAPPEQPLSLNLQRLSTRAKNQVEQKKRLVSALAAGVTPEGQSLYLNITKTIGEVTWAGPNIVVFNDVTITPPYKVDNVTGSPGSRQLTYIKKIVEKYTSDQQQSSIAVSPAGANVVAATAGGAGSTPPPTAATAAGSTTNSSTTAAATVSANSF